MACELGRLYNKQSVLEHLLNAREKMEGDNAVTAFEFSHIKGLKDVVELKVDVEVCARACSRLCLSERARGKLSILTILWRLRRACRPPALRSKRSPACPCSLRAP